MVEVVAGFEKPLPPPPPPNEDEEEKEGLESTAKPDDAKDALAAAPGFGLPPNAPGLIRRRNRDDEDWRAQFTRPPQPKGPPRLWISPNAQGLHKNPFFVLGQNNIKLMSFEREMRGWLQDRGFDVLGMFNLTVQSESLDGTHASMESNLVKAMMVVNWLDSVGRERDGEEGTGVRR